MTQTLAGRYELERVIAEGGMATVWRARDSRLDRSVAVKIMAERISSDPEFRERFMQEAKAAASFSHPNVVDVLDYGEEARPYIVMELVDGEDLRTLLERQRKLAPDEVARIGVGVARGLAAAHRRGLIHRDIKPANILLDGERTPKLADFGIVRALGTATQTKAGTTFGSVHYLSPEQVQGGRVDERSDIYSLGVVLYEAATGERPFDDDAPAAIAVRRLSESPRPPHAVEPSLPQWLSAIIERAMAREAEQRYRSAAELEQDLATHRTPHVRAASEDTVGMPVPVTRPRAGRPVRRAPPPARGQRWGLAPFLAAVVVALAFIGLGLFFLFAGQGAAAVEVPNVVGKPVEEADSVLRSAGLRTEWRCCTQNNRAKGHVYEQLPAAATFAQPGDVVLIYISDGPGSVQVPELRNMTLEEAREALTRAGLVFGSTTDQHDPQIGIGRVIASKPPAFLFVPPGETVDLIRSSGPEPTPSPSPTPSPTSSPTPTRSPTPTPRR